MPLLPRSTRCLSTAGLASALALSACAGTATPATTPVDTPSPTAPITTPTTTPTAPTATPTTTPGARGTSPAPTVDPTSTPDPVADLDDDEAAALARQVNAFGFDLHRGLWARDGGTMMTSPLSASVLLAMLAAGAEGTTGQQFVDVLGLEGTRDERYAGLLAQVVDTDDVEVSTDDALWTAMPLREDYVDTVRDTFGATVESADLGSQEAADDIDAWVRAATQDRIPGIATDLGLPDPSAALVLADAVYFKGSWTTSFDPDDTTSEPFTLPDGQQVEVPTMHAEGMPVEHVSRPVADVLRLPYGDDGRFAMEVFLPGDDLSSFMADFDAERWRDLTDGLHPTTDVDIALPTFELEWGAPLDPVLREPGLVDAYHGGFGAMVDGGGVFLDRVAQKTFVRVDEEGTEAVSVTAGATITSLPPAVHVDRPFAFTISDRRTGAILFLGTVTDPRG